LQHLTRTRRLALTALGVVATSVAVAAPAAGAASQPVLSASTVASQDLDRNGTPDSKQSGQTLVLDGQQMVVPMAATDYTDPTHITCNTAGLYANYTNGRMYDKWRDIPYGERVGWRRNTDDGRAAVVLDYAPENIWGFVFRSCLANPH